MASSSDTVARVDDAVLTQDELQSMLDALPEGISQVSTAANTIDMGLSRQIITAWVINAVVTAEAKQRGIEVAAVDGDPNDPQQLTTQTQTVFAEISAQVQQNPLTEAELQQLYRRYACFKILRVDDAAVAATVVEQLNAGIPFDEVMATNQVTDGPFPSCFEPDEAVSAFVSGVQDPAFEAYGDELTSADEGDVIGPVQTAAGFWVVQQPPIDDLSAEDTSAMSMSVLGGELFANREIEVASMYGKFDPIDGVQPLGIDPSEQLDG